MQNDPVIIRVKANNGKTYRYRNLTKSERTVYISESGIIFRSYICFVEDSYAHALT